MKIAYLCSSLEPGRDGVGDYTRILAQACAERGHPALLIALNDRHVQSISKESIAHDFQILRLPADLSWEKRLESASDSLRNFRPDWLSWQFVPYGYHPKGILPEPLFAFAKSLSGIKIHMMIHELWLGLPTNDPLKHRIYGWLQRRACRRFFHHLKPAVTHTSNEAYRLTLSLEKWPSEVLPLFGNVPVSKASQSECRQTLGQFLPLDAGFPERSHLAAITFGTLHPHWQPEPTAAWLAATASRLGKRPALVIAGRAGVAQSLSKAAFEKAEIPVAITGDQSPETISRLLMAADLGISASPWALIGKSGAASAMREHGLPVLVPRDDWRLRNGPATGPPDDPLLARPADLASDALVDRWLESKRTPRLFLPEVAARFLFSLGGAPLPIS